MHTPSGSLALSVACVALATLGMLSLTVSSVPRVAQEPLSAVASVVATPTVTNTAIISPPQASFRFRVSSYVVDPGGSVSLSWQTSGTRTCTVRGPGVLVTATSGFYRVPSLQQSANYTLMCTLLDGTVRMAQRDVRVVGQPYQSARPTCSISATPHTLSPNNTAKTTLTWSSVNAMMMYIDNGVGVVPTSGSRAVRPATTTLYRAYAVGDSGYAVCDTVPVAIAQSQSCVLDGEVVPHGMTRIFFNRAAAPLDVACSGYAQVRRCNNGVLNGSNSYNKARCVSGKDEDSPFVEILSPRATTTTGTITISAQARDNRGVASVTFKRDNRVISTDTTAPYSATLNTRSLPNGMMPVYAVAKDIKGNSATTSTIIIVHNVSAPTASPVAGVYPTGRTVTLSAPNANSIRYTVNNTIPTCKTGLLYQGGIFIPVTRTIKAIACFPTGSSAVSSFTYTIKP